MKMKKKKEKTPGKSRFRRGREKNKPQGDLCPLSGGDKNPSFAAEKKS